MSKVIDQAVHERRGLEMGIPLALRKYRDPLFDLLPKPCSWIVEIGSQQGWFAWRCMAHVPEAKMWCVDPWLGDTVDGDGLYNFRCWLSNLSFFIGWRVWPIRASSENCPIHIIDIDFLFIDGDHTEDAVFRDLEVWTSRVRPGGLVMGHDWGGKRWGPGVRRAVRSFRKQYPQLGGEELRHGAVYSYDGGRPTQCYWWYR